MNEDIVELILAGETILIAKDYDISIAFMMVPNQFSITIGTGTTAVDLMRRYPANTPFVLKINGVVQFMGRTDGYERPPGEHTELHIVGRDRMAKLLRAHILQDRTFSHATFADLFETALKGAGIAEPTVYYDPRALRHAITGTPVIEDVVIKGTIVSDPVKGTPIDAEPEHLVMTGVTDAVGPTWGVAPATPGERAGVTVVGTFVDKTIQRVTGFKAEKPIEWKAGQTYYQALKKEFDRGGLFARASVDPRGKDENVFLLSEPSAAQDPMFGFVSTREENPADNAVNVLPPHITDVTTGRWPHYLVRARVGGGPDGRKEIQGSYDDAEMIALGYDETRLVVDEHSKTPAQCRYLARKIAAEANRACRVFTYRLPRRHTAPLLRSPFDRAVVAPDVCCSLRDDWNGIEGVFWIERVRHVGSADGPSYTDFTIMVPEDLVFGDGEFLADPSRKVRGKRKRT